jgi:hypothetical protein
MSILTKDLNQLSMNIKLRMANAVVTNGLSDRLYFDSHILKENLIYLQPTIKSIKYLDNNAIIELNKRVPANLLARITIAL